MALAHQNSGAETDGKQAAQQGHGHDQRQE